MRYSKKDYELVAFEKSHRANKKYNAVLINKRTHRVVRIPFGDSRYDQYEDKVPLGLYSHRDHKDNVRRDNFRQRHAHNVDHLYWSPAYFSYNMLW